MDLATGLNIDNAAPLLVGAEPSKKRKKHHKPHEDCQNCGAKLSGEFCQDCGQHGHVHRSVLHVIEEVFHGITHFDSRTWRSLPMLAFRPGTLTREYVMGKRARYVPPFAMFLFSIFAMFLAFAFSGGPGFVSKSEFSKATAVEAARDLVTDAQSEFDDATGELKAAQVDLAKEQSAAEPDAADIAAAKLEVRLTQGVLERARKALADANTALAKERSKPEVTPVGAPSASPTKLKVEIEGGPSFNGQTDPQKALAEIQAEKAKATKEGDQASVAALSVAEAAAKAAPKLNAAAGENTDFMTTMKNAMRDGDFEVNTPWPSINEKIKHKFENPDLFIYKLQNTAYKFSFLLVPLSLPFIWLLLFWKRGVTLFDHAVFSLYSLSFVSFLFLFISLAAHWFDAGPLVGAATMILPVHLFFQFKGAYALKWFSALWRTIVFAGFFSWIVIGMFLVSIVVLGATG
jgi:hypothetical protein